MHACTFSLSLSPKQHIGYLECWIRTTGLGNGGRETGYAGRNNCSCPGPSKPPSPQCLPWDPSAWNAAVRPVAPFVERACDTPVFMGPIHPRFKHEVGRWRFRYNTSGMALLKVASLLARLHWGRGGVRPPPPPPPARSLGGRAAPPRSPGGATHRPSAGRATPYTAGGGIGAALAAIVALSHTLCQTMWTL
jgi:hypothetical protein